MWVLLSGGVRRWVVGSVAVPLGAKALTQIADRLERAEGRTAMSRGLRAAASVAAKRGAKGKQATRAQR